ncbi:LOW QUALITY PROTEIN: transcription factor TFIIIB component B'' homolog [Panonychus citri]|uniref:LOW QUALITY PROTEIN: transcription factor TFIIIB component B'' homolog n=1 Tax=Panonychus citri TaxID=50023 RepID=UPI0023072274|nr:LOW QUALITY PROTEIN: transcription factor TFIIIB component B'' homolog [Panonychus citri]
MFRRSRIKITPKIPQAKTPATELIDSTRLQQQQNLNQQQIYQQPNGSMQGVGHYGQPQHYSQTLERPRSLGINQIDGFHNMDPMTIPQAIPNHPPPAYYPPGSIMNQNPYHTGNQGAINEITSTGSHTPPPSYFATPGTGDSMISINQMTESQLNQGQPTRRINSQGSSSASITSRPSQPPPAPPSNPPAGQSLTRESLPPPPPPPPPSSGMNSVVRGDSLHNELPLPHLPSGTPVDEDAPVNEHGQPSKRIRLTPEDLLNRNSITIFHLIHGSISRTKNQRKRKPLTRAGSKDPENDETPNIENDDSMIIGPRVKVGPDGQIIIDEESLVIKKTKPVETTSVEESVSGKTTYASFRKRPPTARWSKTETIEFYTALNLIGPDFSLMSTLFFNGKRTRTDLKNKFRRENKLNQPVIEKALYEADVDYCLARVAS